MTTNTEHLRVIADAMPDMETKVEFLATMCAFAQAARESMGRDAVLEVGCLDDIETFASAAFGDAAAADMMRDFIIRDVMGTDTDEVHAQLEAMWSL